MACRSVVCSVPDQRQHACADIRAEGHQFRGHCAAAAAQRPATYAAEQGGAGWGTTARWARLLADWIVDGVYTLRVCPRPGAAVSLHEAILILQPGIRKGLALAHGSLADPNRFVLVNRQTSVPSPTSHPILTHSAALLTLRAQAACSGMTCGRLGRAASWQLHWTDENGS